jgi:iron(III) transport system ATP-binding protein
VARPEDLALAAPAPEQANAVPGQVLRRQFLGARTVYRVRLAAGAEVLVEQHASGMGAGFRAGDAVQVLLPARCRVVAG